MSIRSFDLVLNTCPTSTTLAALVFVSVVDLSSLEFAALQPANFGSLYLASCQNHICRKFAR